MIASMEAFVNVASVEFTSMDVFVEGLLPWKRSWKLL